MMEYGCMSLLQLAAPGKPRDWRVITAYEGSLCYALLTRNMTYCENLVVEMTPERIETIIRSHKGSV
jgi:hypothetical protein